MTEYDINTNRDYIQKLYDDVNNQYLEIKTECSKLKEQLSYYDKYQEDILHKIEELITFNLYKAWLIITEIHSLRVDRRKVKNKLEIVESLKDTLYNQKQTYYQLLNKVNKKINFIKNPKYTNKVFTGTLIYNNKTI